MIFAAIGIGAALLGLNEQNKARKEQQRANAAAERAEAVRAQRERVKAVRAQRMAVATATAGAAGTGMLGSSTYQGAVGGFMTQSNVNMNFADQINSLTQQQLSLQSSAANRLQMAQLYSGLGELAMGVQNQANKVAMGQP